MNYDLCFPIECLICGKIFKNLKVFRQHINTAHGKEIDFNEYLLKFHNLHIPKRVGKKFIHQCVICGKTIKSLSGVGVHLKNQHKEIKYEDYLNNNLSLNRHSHDYEKVECQICHKLFINLCQHLRHTHRDFDKERYEKAFGEISLHPDYIARSSGKAATHTQKVKGLSPLERFQLTFGEEGGLEKYENWRNQMSSVFTLPWFIKKYGEDVGTGKYQERCRKIGKETTDKKRWLNKKLSPYSKISQRLFQAIYQKIKGKYQDIYFGELNHEFSCGTDRNFDFVIKDIKKVIEFNGEKFHVNPSLTKEQRDQWRQVFTGKTSVEVENSDMIKIENAKRNGYSFLIVWESDYVKNQKKVLQDCLRFLEDK